jgi:hypothetical protein
MGSSPKRTRIRIEVRPELRRRFRMAAAKQDRTVQQCVLEAVEERLREDLGDESEAMPALSAATDPALAELWDNKKDAQYDR